MSIKKNRVQQCGRPVALSQSVLADPEVKMYRGNPAVPCGSKNFRYIGERVYGEGPSERSASQYRCENCGHLYESVQIPDTIGV